MLGSIIGSFLNVLVYRIPRNLSIVYPRSFCPKCGVKIPIYRNIPIFSYITQWGRCNNCFRRISPQYPFVELVSGCALVFTMTILPFPKLILFYWMITHLLVLSIIDQKWKKVPISILISMALGIVIYQLVWSIDILESLSGIIVGSGFIAFVIGLNWFIFHKQTMGFGDLIIIAIMGAWLGAIQIFLTIFIASILALLAIIIKSIFYGFNRSDSLPFVPYLSIAAFLLYFINPS